MFDATVRKTLVCPWVVSYWIAGRDEHLRVTSASWGKILIITWQSAPFARSTPANGYTGFSCTKWNSKIIQITSKRTSKSTSISTCIIRLNGWQTNWSDVFRKFNGFAQFQQCNVMIVCVGIEIPVSDYGTDCSHFGLWFGGDELIMVAEDDADFRPT